MKHIARFLAAIALALLGFGYLSLAASATPPPATTTTLIDQSGNRIVVKKPFTRIISLYGAHTENLFSLGLDKEVIGVSEHEAYPPQASSKEVFSYHDNPEKFIAARPDLVLIRPMIAMGYANLLAKLRQAGITVVSLQPRTVQDIYRYWRDLGLLTGRTQQAEAMIGEFNRKMQHIRDLVQTIPAKQRKRVYFEAIHGRMKTFSPSSIAMFALKTAGGINVAEDAQARHDTNIAAYGKEHILAKAGGIDVYLAQRGFMNRVTVRQIRDEPGFKLIKAVRNGQIHIVDEKIVSRPTLRLLDGVYEIGRFLYPSVFNDVSSFASIAALSRAQFAEMFVKMTNMPLKTPDYRRDIAQKAETSHRYGDFTDIDYTGNDYKFIETAVYRGIFAKMEKAAFHPNRPITRREVAYALFVYYDLPEVAQPVVMQDVDRSSLFFEQIRTAVGLGIMSLNPEHRFRPEAPISGGQALRSIEKAMQTRR